MSRLRAAIPLVETVYAEYRHFAALTQELSAPELGVLERLLTYGPKLESHTPQGDLLLVVPRLGTISPWSTKATDIAQHCTLKNVRRLERGVAWFVHKRGGAALTADERRQVSELIHNRITAGV